LSSLDSNTLTLGDITTSSDKETFLAADQVHIIKLVSAIDAVTNFDKNGIV